MSASHTLTPLQLQQRVCAMLEITSEAYAQYQYDRAIEYLNEQGAPAHITTQPDYWHWWRRQWHIRDHCWLQLQEDTCAELFYNGTLTRLHLVPRALSPAQLRTSWRRAHSYSAIRAHYSPSSF